MDYLNILETKRFTRWYIKKLRDARNMWRDKAVKLKEKVDQLDFFYEGNGFKKRGLNNSIQIADYIDELEKCKSGIIIELKHINKALVTENERLRKKNTELEEGNKSLKKQVTALEITTTELDQHLHSVGYENFQYKEQLAKADDIINDLYYVIQGRIDYTDNIPLNDTMERANSFINRRTKKSV